MIKIIYSSAYDKTADIGMRVIEDFATLTKSAGTIFGMDYDALKPDKDHVGIHVTALGDWEHYGANRNGDTFPKAACVKYHDTFVKHGSVFRHHKNKDREKNLGAIKASAYNDEMGRIELFVHAHKERAADELARLEKEGEICFSMACRVPGDRCTICNNFRKNAADPNMCDHIRYDLGKMFDDGKVAATHNDDPEFFDISFVGRPADRIAWNLKVAAGEVVDSVKLAEADGIYVPDHMAIESASALKKLSYLKKLAVFQEVYSRKPITPTEKYFYELRKAACAQVSDKVIEELRKLEPREAFRVLAKAGAVLDVESFFKYAMGPMYAEVAPLIPAIKQAVPAVIRESVQHGNCQELCNDGTFDVSMRDPRLPVALLQKCAEYSIVGPIREERIIYATLTGAVPKIAVDSSQGIMHNGVEIAALATKYAAYKLSALEALLDNCTDTDVDTVIAITAAQNLIGA